MNDSIKASILMSISEFDIERGSLVNTLHSIARQETSFLFELCIIDDACGLEKIDIFIKGFFKENPNPNLKRIIVKSLEEKLGFISAPSQAIKLISPESQKMFILASDCILLKKTSVQQVLDRLEPKKVVFSEVAEINISHDFHKKFLANANIIIRHWDAHLLKEPPMVSRNIPTAWLFFAGGALKEDLLAIDYDKISCDAVLWQKMMPSNYKAEILSYVKVAHQSHVRTSYPCPRVEECKFHCSRTLKLKGTMPPSRKLAAVIEHEDDK